MSEVMESTDYLESVDDFWDKAGPMPTGPSDVRRFPRFYFRSCAEAMIYSLDRNNPSPAHHFLATSNLSRGGVSLLHKDQLYPGQRLDVILNGEPARTTEVVWCRRLAAARYVVGCRFIVKSGD
jgi:hypothetical protein